MKPAFRHEKQLDARQLILDADFDVLSSLPEATVVELARQWTAQVGSWLGISADRLDEH